MTSKRKPYKMHTKESGFFAETQEKPKSFTISVLRLNMLPGESTTCQPATVTNDPNSEPLVR